VRDSRSREKIGATATTRVNRKDFGIVWNEVMDSGGWALADEVSITLDIELLKATPEVGAERPKPAPVR
jgi:polyisoprenoid-binding protein YceI